ncbi:MAG TPA: PIN domain-containing protein [Terriglobales bacterium]
MKRFLDTSVLVATVLGEHPQHAPSLAIYAESEKRNSYCGSHSLAEIYAAVTRIPGKQRMSSDQALLFLDDVGTKLTVVPLDAADYFSTLASASAAGIIGGTIYDALLAHCALKSGAEVIYTWNVADFRRLGPEIARRVRTP